MSNFQGRSVSRTFDPEAGAASSARAFILHTLRSWQLDHLGDDAALLTSELVINAVTHAGTPIDVTCVEDRDGVEIAVRDRLPQRPVQVKARDFFGSLAEETDIEGGLGLVLTGTIASAWGVNYTRADKTVWFRLGTPATPTVSARAIPFREDISATADDLHVAVVRTDGDGRVQAWNDDATQLFGWPAEKAQDRLLAELTGGGQPSITDILGLARWLGPYEFQHCDGTGVGVFISYLRSRNRNGGTSATWLAVPLAHRAMLEGSAKAKQATTVDDEWSALDEAVNSRLTLDELLARTVVQARTVLGGDAAYVVLATGEDRAWELRTAVGLQPEPWQPVTLQTNTLYAEATDALPMIHDDLTAAPFGMTHLAAAGMRSLVTAALVVEGRVTGRLGVAARLPQAFDQDSAVRLQRAADRVALSVERGRLAEVELGRRASLNFLAEASDLLAGTLDEEKTAALAAQLAVSRLGSWCAIHTIDEFGAPQLSYVWHRDERRIDSIRRLLEKVPPPEPSSMPGGWRWLEPRIFAGRGPFAKEIAQGSILSLPLVGRGRSLGTLTIGRPPGDPFSREICDVAEGLARRVSSALDNARLYSSQASMSQALQHSLLPAEVPEVPGVDLALRYQPAGEGTVVGGDFYDVFNCGRWWSVAIGDVCGTGPGAAAVTGLARHTLRVLAREGHSPEEIVTRLNEAILEEGPRARLLTLLYGQLEPRDGAGMRLRLISAGHPLPLRLRPGGEVEFVATPQLLLGAFEDAAFQAETVEFDPGDVLLCVTDGVTERRNGEVMLGDDGLAKILQGCVGLTAGAVAASIERALDEFAPEGHDDDTALLVLRFR